MKLIEHYFQHLKLHNLTTDNYPAVSEKDLTAFEAKYQKLPPLLREIYSRLDGQRSHVLQESNYRLLPMEYIPSAIEDLIDNAEHHFGLDYETSAFYPNMIDDESVKNTPYHKAWIPFMEVKGNRYYAIDYAPEKMGKVGQVVLLSVDRNQKQEPMLVYDNIEECIEDIIKTSFEDLDMDSSIEDFETFMHQAYERLREYDMNAPKHQSALLAHFGQFGTVRLFHQDDEISLFHLAPSAKFPYQLLFTVGMSSQAMNVPAALSNPEEHAYAELMMCFGADVNLEREDYAWAAQWLHILANLPFEHHQWLTAGHSIPLSKPLPRSRFTGFLVAPPLGLPRSLHHLEHDGTHINLYAALTLFPDELKLVQEQGVEKLIPLLNNAHFTAEYNPDRASVLGKAK